MYSEFTDTEIPMSKTEIVSFFVVYLRNYKFISIKTIKTFNDSKIIKSTKHCLVYYSKLYQHNSLSTALPINVGAEILSTVDLEKDEEEDEKETQVYEKHNDLLHGENSRKKFDFVIYFILYFSSV